MKLHTPIRHFKLSNGLLVHYMHAPDMNTCCISATVHTGSSHDPKGRYGLAHFVEHMSLAGNEEYPKLARNAALEARSILHNAYTDHTATNYHYFGVSTHVKFMIKMMELDLLSPTFNPEDVETERTVIESELKMRVDDPSTNFFDKVITYALNGSSYSRPIIGNLSGIKAITRHDLRDYTTRRHVANNIEILIVGNFDPDAAMKQLEGWHLETGRRTTGKGTLYQDKTATPNMTLPALQSSWFSSCHLHSYNEADNHELMHTHDAAVDIFSAGTSCRMWTTLRENKGLCYTCGAYDIEYPSYSMIATYVNCSNDNLHTVKETLQALIDKYICKGVTKTELENWKSRLYNRKMIAADNAMIVANQYTRDSIIHKHEWQTLEEQVEGINNVTVDQVNDMIPRIFNDIKVVKCTLTSE